MWLYYITDRKQFPGGPAQQRRRLLDKIAEATRAGVDFIQLREKDLASRDLEELARDALSVIVENSPSPQGAKAGGQTFSGPRPSPRLLINSRVDVAIAVGAPGVHLPAGDLSAREVRDLWDHSASLTGAARREPQAVVGVSCHSIEEVRRAEADGADFAVFAPVFEKIIGVDKRPGTGLGSLRAACKPTHPVAPTRDIKQFPVFALGGVTLKNAKSCTEAGAVGIAAIRLFQENEVEFVVNRLRTDRSERGTQT